MKRTFFLSLNILFLCSFLRAQDFTGYDLSNYSGIHGLRINPAMIADSRYSIDINLVDDNFYFLNNYIGVHRDLMFHYDTTFDHVPWNVFKQKYFFERTTNADKFFYLNNTIGGPGVMISLGPKRSFAITSKQRTVVMMDNVNDSLAHLIWDELEYPPYWNVRLYDQNMGLFANSWIEYGASYAQEVYNKGEHYVKVGGTFKLLQGLGAAYIYSRGWEYEWNTSDTLSLYNMDVAFGHSNNFDIPGGEGEFNFDNHYGYRFQAKASPGFDFGVIYEWRPDYDQYTYSMDGADGLMRNDQNKYKLRAGLSVLDIGRIKYAKGYYSGDFHADIDEWNVHPFKWEGVLALDDTFVNRFITLEDTANNFFNMPLPTAISVQVDWNIWKDVFLGLVSYNAFRFEKKESKIRALTLYTLTPRWERQWHGIGLPFSFTEAKQLNVGLSIRTGPLVIGSSDFTPLLFKEKTFGADVYVALRVPISQKRPKDKDHDTVSDKMDECVETPGTWDFKGCPDTDKDGLRDLEDACPLVFGPKENHGCPWPDTDKDGVLDKDDHCIDVPGPVENNGCPYGDLDKDGVLDNVDHCIDVPGPEENFGCPYGDLDKDGVLDNDDACIDVPGPAENKGCPYADFDKDGVLDQDDQCPLTPGLVELHGCPKLEKEEEEILKIAFENLEFETGKAVIRSSSFASLDELAALLVKKPTYGLRISGHTDNVGSEESNLILSRNRAQAVKDYLVAKGVDGGKLVVEYHGESQPIATNDTPEGRQKNRRVEMTIIFQ